MKLKVVRLPYRKYKHRVKTENPFPLNFSLTEITRNTNEKISQNSIPKY